VAKLADAPYRAGRQESWIKVRCLEALNFPVIGYVPAKPNSIAAIRLARREAGGLYAGKAGTGFTMKSAQNVRKGLEPLMRRTPPTAKPLRKRDTVWVEPRLSADRVSRRDRGRHAAPSELQGAGVRRIGV
jgi:bifunctional non-homologous end joining protein LigD